MILQKINMISRNIATRRLSVLNKILSTSVRHTCAGALKRQYSTSAKGKLGYMHIVTILLIYMGVCGGQWSHWTLYTLRKTTFKIQYAL